MNNFLAGAAATLLLATAAQAALVGRDINGAAVASNDASSVFLYDTTLNITWLRDANPLNDEGLFFASDWAGANDWASALTVGTFGSWRLPSFRGVFCGGSNCRGGEMGHLYYTELGNGPGDRGFPNAGAFQGIGETDFRYWYKEDAGSAAPGLAWYFDFFDGTQAQAGKTSPILRLAVRDGDVLTTAVAPAAVPLPAAAWLMLAGAGALAATARRRRNTAAAHTDQTEART